MTVHDQLVVADPAEAACDAKQMDRLQLIGLAAPVGPKDHDARLFEFERRFLDVAEAAHGNAPKFHPSAVWLAHQPDRHQQHQVILVLTIQFGQHQRGLVLGAEIHDCR